MAFVIPEETILYLNSSVSQGIVNCNASTIWRNTDLHVFQTNSRSNCFSPPERSFSPRRKPFVNAIMRFLTSVVVDQKTMEFDCITNVSLCGHDGLVLYSHFHNPGADNHGQVVDHSGNYSWFCGVVLHFCGVPVELTCRERKVSILIARNESQKFTAVRVGKDI